MLKNNKGYNLLELMVVVLILAILAGIAIPNYRSSIEKTRITSKMAIIKSIHDALIQVYPLRQGFPDKLRSLHVTLPSEAWTYDGQTITEKNPDSSGQRCVIQLDTASSPNALNMTCNNEWKLSFTFVDNNGSIAPGDRFFIITSNDTSRISALSKAASSSRWQADANNPVKFKIE
ncbi:MAG: prepilin-type N-terminal cleavage/methylation domain-containing protein [Elusimicrobiota bacterium]|jgi:prepilin-type N-terminal cleavage/methylation domain-containing protein|nr:prepilin-type N-terminal cleavage/methylation domain-containing protein [Elusimicrobiota bacterium]